MKKIITLLAICFIAIANVKAQYVTIPDASFRAFLENKYPSAFNAAHEMDTTNSLIVNEIGLYCSSNANIASVDGLQYFDNLQEFGCPYNQLTNLPKMPISLLKLQIYNNFLSSLPVIPSSLRYLDCSNNQLGSLPILPASLLYLYSSNNQLTILPTLPANLIDLYCGNNQLISLQALPSTLRNFDCSNNQLSNLPGLPNSIEYLFCNNNLLTGIPTLPSNLYELCCNNNQLTSLPTLPSTLSIIFCSTNQLTSLPTLPANIGLLNCSSNQLTSLPNLPSSFYMLQCGNNQLTSLPILPQNIGTLTCDTNLLTSLPILPNTISVLSCSNNNIQCLPKLPSTLLDLHLDSSKIKCLPNLFSGLTIYNGLSNIITLSVCNSTNNPNNCQTFGVAPNYVNIPDTNFGKFLLAQYPSCLYKDASNLYWMDTTCSGVANATYLYCNGLGIIDLTGVQYFKNLFFLDCTNNDINSIPSLPDSLVGFYCDDNQLTSLPALPSKLAVLNCGNNKLTTLPTLPVKLGQLGCSSNLLTSLPTIPNKVQNLACTNNQLTSLPILPSNLLYLYCDNNKLTSLPSLPSTLEQVYCSSNQLTNLPIIPNNIWIFNCSDNKLTSLPTLPNGLTFLKCGNNQLTSLPLLPNNISFLTCDTNLLTSLPVLPNTISVLGCSNNNIQCLPNLPSTLAELHLDSSKISCIPNSVSGLTIYNGFHNIISLSICNATNNPNNCPIILANYVNIPDINFGAFLLTKYPSCLYKDASNLYWMDTTCSSVVNADTINCSLKNILNFDGIQYFKNLKYLDCSLNSFTSIPNLSSKLEYLNCTSCENIISLPSLGSNLKYLICRESGLQSLPALPNTLQYLNVYGVPLVNLPALPNSLKFLDCTAYMLNVFQNRYITNLPALPSSLDSLNIFSQKITSLPTLPGSLVYLDCGSNAQLNCLPHLPNSLKRLRIQTTNITCLPNNVNGLTIDSDSTLMPICNNTNNPNNCPVYPPNYVNIPDTSFGSFLLTKYPSCLYKDASNLYWMDTTCSGVVNEDSLNCFNKQIKSIIGVEYFKNLLQLNCRYNMLTGLPSLPKGIKELDCSANLLIALPVLYDSLKILNCSQNKLTGLPSLPKGIKELNCFNNQIMTLPILPDSLRLLYCTSNLLTYIPVLPDSLYLLDCGGNKIDSLPTLPNSLRILFCSYNLLNQLPALNNSISVLGCSGNKLTSLPTLPDSLLYLYCDYNKLTSLPPLPNKLVYFECENNLLSGLPTLPVNLVSLTISNNNISCLPKLPSGLQIFGSYNTNINCLPNGFVGYDSSFHPPICNPTNNANQCVAFPTVAGRVFTDNNSNGIKDTNEFYRPFVKEIASNGDATFSNLNGAFAFSFDSTGSYSLKTIAPKYFKAVPDSNSFSFANNNVYISVPDIALQPTAVKDSLAIVVTPLNSRARPGFGFPYYLGYANAGTTNLYTTVSFTYDTSRLVYDSSSVAIISNTNNTIVISIDSLIAGQGKYATLYFTVKPTAVIGDTLFAVANATSPATTASSANATIIRGSFDPNDKVATPQLTPTQVANGDWIEYTIRFQNTGNDTAVNVVLADSLSILLQPGYFNVVATSHLANLTYSFKNNIVYFEFLNINLPDSATNYNASQGWVTFKVKPLSGVAVGTYIDNKASIYFDYNKPIVTNLARTLISTIVPIKLLNYSLRLTQEDKKVVENIWTTANEINASHFNIQRSIDGVNFKTVGQVKAVGVSSYSFTDNSLSSNEKQKTIFYRLQMVDNDGRFEYSPIREISIQPSISSIRIYPNPAKELVTIECANARELSITDYLGKRIFNKKIMNNQSSIINLQGFAKGIYLVQVVLDNGSIKTEKLIVE